MLKGVVVQRLVWESHKVLLWALVPPLRRSYIQLAIQEFRESKLRDQQYARGGKVTLGAKSHPTIVHC